MQLSEQKDVLIHAKFERIVEKTQKILNGSLICLNNHAKV